MTQPQQSKHNQFYFNYSAIDEKTEMERLTDDADMRE